MVLGKTIAKLTDGFSGTPRRPSRKSPVIELRPPAAPPITPSDLSAYYDTAIAEAEAVRQARIIRNVDRAIHTPSVTDYIQNTVVNPDTVNVQTWDYSNATGITLAPFQARILTHVLTPDPKTGRFPYRTVIWSAPKKSGKTGNAAFGGCWIAEYVEPPNLILVAANTQGQSIGRIFNSMAPTLKLNGARIAGNKIILKNGTVVEAITNSPKAEAGANYGAVFISELWGWDGERAKTLWAETMPVPTKLNSIRWVETYVGYEDTSEQLLSLWLNVFTDTTESELQAGAEPVPELADITTTDAFGNQIPCCYRVPKESMFLFVDHEHRFDWQTPEYYASVTVGMTEADIMRLVHNRWQKTDTKFITADMLATAELRGRDLTSDGLSVFEGIPRRVPAAKKMTLAVDASQGRIDSTALVGCYSEFDPTLPAADMTEATGGDVRFRVPYFKAYAPTGDDFDLDNLVGDEIVRLWKAGLIKRREPDGKESALIKENAFLIPIAVFYDPTQMHQVAVNLRKKHKLLIKEFQQGNERIKADTFLHRVFKSYQIDVPTDETLHSHLDAAKAQHQNRLLKGKKGEELDTGLRIVKPKAAVRAIDGAVAMSMAVWSESMTPPQRRRAFGSLHLGKTKGL